MQCSRDLNLSDLLIFCFQVLCQLSLLFRSHENCLTEPIALRQREYSLYFANPRLLGPSHASNTGGFQLQTPFFSLSTTNSLFNRTESKVVREDQRDGPARINTQKPDLPMHRLAGCGTGSPAAELQHRLSGPGYPQFVVVGKRGNGGVGAGGWCNGFPSSDQPGQRLNNGGQTHGGRGWGKEGGKNRFWNQNPRSAASWRSAFKFHWCQY